MRHPVFCSLNIIFAYIQVQKTENLTPICQVMKDWSDLEEKYQGMRVKDAGAAEDFKKQMTERFQKTVQALEEESQAEKRQLQVEMICG